MSFLMKLKQKSRQSRTRSQIWQSRCLPPRLHRLLLNLPPQLPFAGTHARIRSGRVKDLCRKPSVRMPAAGNTRPSAASIFSMEPASGTRATTVRERLLLANFYPFLSRDRMQEKEILTQSKRLFSGYRYEVRYTLSKTAPFISIILKKK